MVKRLQGGEGPEVALKTLDDLQSDVTSPEDQEFLNAERKRAENAHRENEVTAANIAKTLSLAEKLSRGDNWLDKKE